MTNNPETNSSIAEISQTSTKEEDTEQNVPDMLEDADPPHQPNAVPEPQPEPLPTADTDSELIEDNFEKYKPKIRAGETILLRFPNIVEDTIKLLLPWEKARTWTVIKKCIQTAISSERKKPYVELEDVDFEDFELFVHGERVLDEHWEMLAEPGWVVDVWFRVKSKPSKSKSPEPIQIQDKNFIRYTIDYYEATGSWKNYFHHRRSFDEHSALELDGIHVDSNLILEEKLEVMRDFPKELSGPQNRNEPVGPRFQFGDRPRERYILIHSTMLVNVLRSVIKYSLIRDPKESEDDRRRRDSGDSSDSSMAKFAYPYHELFYHRHELANYKTQTAGCRKNHDESYNEECDRHIDVLLQFLESDKQISILTFEANLAKDVPTTNFPALWVLLKPGTDVYELKDGQLDAYVVDTVNGGVQYFSDDPWSIKAEPYSVDVWYLVFDGKMVTRKSKTIKIPVFNNEMKVTSLPLFPTRFYDQVDGGLRRQQLITRGHKFFDLTKKPAYMEYTGVGLKPGWKKYNRARVIIEHKSQPWKHDDFKSMENFNLNLIKEPPRPPLWLKKRDIGQGARAPRCECNRCTQINSSEDIQFSVVFSDYSNIDPKVTESISDHQAFICMSHMFGFVLKDRVYELMDIDGFDTPIISKDAIDRLVMRPEKNKETIKAIVQTYTDTRSQNELFSADFIHGKGEGQVFLLHGPPGTGKTLTAESVAEYTKRPLLSITAADLGHEPIDLERNLLQFFRNASSWDAIVLLDEADVYLERRSTNDLRRNSIVSIFLRALDYFQGILFLTTNRVGQFDEAFLSRIHVSIGYNSLDDLARDQIWTNLFRKLKDDHKQGGTEIRYEYDAKEFVRRDKQLRKLEWNGREIRNAFQTAVALAIHDSKVARDKNLPADDCVPEVKESHIRQIVTMSTAFKNYITATHEGVEDSDLAFKLGNRDDKFTDDSA